MASVVGQGSVRTVATVQQSDAIMFNDLIMSGDMMIEMGWQSDGRDCGVEFS